MIDHTFILAGVPPLLTQALGRYVDQGVPTGDFLNAVLENNLKMAYWLADPNSRAAIPHLIQWLHWEAPPQCHGSPEKVQAWIQKFKKETNDTNAN